MGYECSQCYKLYVNNRVTGCVPRRRIVFTPCKLNSSYLNGRHIVARHSFVRRPPTFTKIFVCKNTNSFLFYVNLSSSGNRLKFYRVSCYVLYRSVRLSRDVDQCLQNTLDYDQTPTVLKIINVEFGYF